jgi:hypothetical protein
MGQTAHMGIIAPAAFGTTSFLFRGNELLHDENPGLSPQWRFAAGLLTQAVRLNLLPTTTSIAALAKLSICVRACRAFARASCPTHSYRKLLGFGSDLIPGFANETADWIGPQSFRDGWMLGQCLR